MPKKHYWKVHRFLQVTWFRPEHWLLIRAVLWNYSSKSAHIQIHDYRFLMSGAEYTHYNPLIFVVMHVCDDLTWCCKYGTSTLSRRDWMIVSVILKPIWFKCNCFFKMHSCTGIQVSSWKPDLFSDQTSSLSLSLSFIAPSQLSLTHLFLLSALRLNHSALLFRSSSGGE